MERTKHKEKETPFFGLPDIGIPSEVLFHPKLTNTEKMLFGFLRNLSQTEKGCWASNRWLGGLLGVGPQTITNAISNLKKHHYILTIEERTTDGRNVRRIFINPEYPLIYRNLVVEGYKNINGPLLENLYPSIKKLIDPYKKSYNKIDIEKDKEEDKEKDYLSDLKRSDDEPIYNGELTIKERNKQYIPVVKKLSSIIQEIKNVKHTPSQLRSWTNEIRQLVENNNISMDRIMTALDWYGKHIGEEYIPVIESGRSFREKFVRLEDAMKRGNNNIPKSRVTIGSGLTGQFDGLDEWLEQERKKANQA